MYPDHTLPLRMRWTSSRGGAAWVAALGCVLVADRLASVEVKCVVYGSPWRGPCFTIKSWPHNYCWITTAADEPVKKTKKTSSSLDRTDLGHRFVSPSEPLPSMRTSNWQSL